MHSRSIMQLEGSERVDVESVAVNCHATPGLPCERLIWMRSRDKKSRGSVEGLEL